MSLKFKNTDGTWSYISGTKGRDGDEHVFIGKTAPTDKSMIWFQTTSTRDSGVRRFDINTNDWVLLPGTKGVGVQSALVNEDGNLILTLDDTAHTQLDAGYVIGKPGEEIEIRNNGIAIQWKYSRHTDWTDLIALEEISAYGAAKKGGYTGTEEDFNKRLSLLYNEELVFYSNSIGSDTIKAHNLELLKTLFTLYRNGIKNVPVYFRLEEITYPSENINSNYYSPDGVYLYLYFYKNELVGSYASSSLSSATYKISYRDQATTYTYENQSYTLGRVQESLAVNTQYIYPLSANQGRILNEKFQNYLPLSGGKMTGDIVLKASNSSITGNSLLIESDSEVDKLYNGITITNGVSIFGDKRISTRIASISSIKRTTGSQEYRMLDDNNFVADTDYITPTTFNTSISKYLPLTGGTISGALQLSNTTCSDLIVTGQSSSGLKFFDNTSKSSGILTKDTSFDLFWTKDIADPSTKSKILTERNFNPDIQYVTPAKVIQSPLTGYTASTVAEDIIASDTIKTALQKLGFYTKAGLYTKAQIDAIVSGLFKYKGSVTNYTDLPTSNLTGDTWNVVNAYSPYPAGTNYTWDGTKWNPLGGAFSLTKSSIEEVFTGNITSHTHSYLPLTGGTVSGNIILSGAYFVGHNVLTGGAMVFHDGSRTILGSIDSTTTKETIIRSVTGNVLTLHPNGTTSLLLSTTNFLPGRDYVSNSNFNTTIANYLPLTGGTLTGNLTGTGIYAQTLVLRAANNPQINFYDTVTSSSRLLFRAGNELKFRFDGTSDALILNNYNHAPGVNYVTPSGNITGSSGSCTGNAATASAAVKVFQNGAAGNVQMAFNWIGQTGQPAWLWGGNGTGENQYVYNPSNFSVAYAASSGVANTLDATKVYTASNFGTSDKRLKRAIKPITEETLQEAIETIKLNRSFIYKKNGIKSYGPIAQDLEEVLPELVYTNEKGIKGVNNSALLHLQTQSLYNLIQELTNKVSSLEEQLLVAGIMKKESIWSRLKYFIKRWL